MYRKLRIKISLFSITVLLLLFLGTIAVVYGTSYRQTIHAEQEMLALYAEAYWEDGNPAEDNNLPPLAPPPEEAHTDAMPRSTGQFGSVELDGSENVVSVNNPDQFRLTDADLIALARQFAAGGKQFGVKGTWVCYLENHDEHTLITFLDNTLFSGSSSLLLINTLRYGSLMIVILCFVVWFTSGLLVRPLENNEREQRRFISDAGHELKTPVSVIATNAALLQREIGSNRWLENIIAENERSGELIRNLLELAGTQEKQTPKVRVNLSDIAESIILPFEGVSFEKGHMLRASVQPDLYMLGNERQLSTLISILLDNAVQYSTDGSEIGISVLKEKHHLAVRVSNQSEEMSAAQCRQLFERFYRSDSSRTGSGHYGLGLSIAQKIVRIHHGTISASWKDGVITFQAVFSAADA